MSDARAADIIKMPEDWLGVNFQNLPSNRVARAPSLARFTLEGEN
jgi:hypothetical protein